MDIYINILYMYVDRHDAFVDAGGAVLWRLFLPQRRHGQRELLPWRALGPLGSQDGPGPSFGPLDSFSKGPKYPNMKHIYGFSIIVVWGICFIFGYLDP